MDPSIQGLPALYRYRFRFEAEQGIRMPPMPGSAWRGLLGHGLRKAACVTRSPTCEGCLLRESCIHNRVFESDFEGEARYRKRPHPFVLEVEMGGRWREIAAGEAFELGITLFASAREALPYLIHAFERGGREGFGRGRGRFTLRSVDALDGGAKPVRRPLWHRDGGKLEAAGEPLPTPPPLPPGSLTIELSTPLRIKERGRLVRPEEFTAGHFLRALSRRARDVGRFYGTAGSFTPPQEPAGVVLSDGRLAWHDWRRFSSRQKGYMNMGGIVGSFRLSGDRLVAWWPLIWYGQWLHLGKGTSMGMGKYRVKEG